MFPAQQPKVSKNIYYQYRAQAIQNTKQPYANIMILPKDAATEKNVNSPTGTKN